MNRVPLSIVNEYGQCGGCTACCTVIGVKELGKPYYQSCKDLCSGGCRIYETRPEECRHYQCGWLIDKGTFLSTDLRPDRSGIILHATEDMDGTGWLELYEVWEGAWTALFPSARLQFLNLVDALSQFIPKYGGLRLYPANSVVAQLYPVSPEYVDHGQAWMDRQFETTDGRHYLYRGCVPPKRRTSDGGQGSSAGV